MRNRLLYIATLLALGLSAGPAAALPCAGFTDVEDTSPFCPNVEWLKNRAVTTGCTSTTLYCPTDAVSRLAMAAFMNRLGKALTPVTLHKEALASNVTVGTPAVYCVTDDLPAATQPRTARFAGSVFGVPSAYGGSWLQGWWKYSTDQGVTWNYVGNWLVNQFYGRDWADYGQVVGFPVFAPPMDLAAGSVYRFGLFLNGNGGTYTFQSLICAADVTITNNNPAISPLDAD
jgi:hypothetical protein